MGTNTGVSLLPMCLLEAYGGYDRPQGGIAKQMQEAISGLYWH